MLRTKARKLIGKMLPESGVRRALKNIDASVQDTLHGLGTQFPFLIRPQAKDIFLSLTAHCNLRCIGCKYGRDFMPGRQLPWDIAEPMLEDAAELGYSSIRLYGGEPLLHPDLNRIIVRSLQLGINPWVTTNAMLLEQKIAGMYEAGLRELNIGFYGVGDEFNSYVQRGNDRFARFESAVAHMSKHYGDRMNLGLAWLLMKPTFSSQALNQAWDFALKYNIPMTINLVHYSLPYFTEGPDGMLQFKDEDRQGLEDLVEEMLQMKQDRPEMLLQTEAGLRSIPDWLLKQEEMKVPCDKYDMLWIGPDGSVQLCYVTFPFGNLHEKRLKEMLFGPDHVEAARKCFALDCPNCHCGFNSRIEKHAPSMRTYSLG